MVNDGLNELFNNDSIKSMTRDEYNILKASADEIRRIEQKMNEYLAPHYEPVTYKALTTLERVEWAIKNAQAVQA